MFTCTYVCMYMPTNLHFQQLFVVVNAEMYEVDITAPVDDSRFNEFKKVTHHLLFRWNTEGWTSGGEGWREGWRLY